MRSRRWRICSFGKMKEFHIEYVEIRNKITHNLKCWHSLWQKVGLFFFYVYSTTRSTTTWYIVVPWNSALRCLLSKEKIFFENTIDILMAHCFTDLWLIRIWKSESADKILSSPSIDIIDKIPYVMWILRWKKPKSSCFIRHLFASCMQKGHKNIPSSHFPRYCAQNWSLH